MTGLKQRNCFRSIYNGLELNSLRISALFPSPYPTTSHQIFCSTFPNTWLPMKATNLQSPTDHPVQLTLSYLPRASQWLPGLLPSSTQGTGCRGGMMGQQGGLALSLLPCLELSRARLFQQITDPNSRTQLWLPRDSQNMSQMSVLHVTGGPLRPTPLVPPHVLFRLSLSTWFLL